MGVTLHYNGKLKSIADTEVLKEEIVDICKTKNWRYNFVVDDPSHPDAQEPFLNGLFFGPEGCDPIVMTFDSSGMLFPFVYKLIDKEKLNNEKSLLDTPTSFTKTQYTGPETHIEICNLLKYLSEKYFDEWNCYDDSGYYDHGDKERLIESMASIDRAFEALDDAISIHGEKIDQLSPEELKSFIQNVLKGQNVDIRSINVDDEEV